MTSRPQIWIALFLVMTPAVGCAQSCDMLQYNSDDARSRLQRATRAADLDDAKEQARRARNSLEDAALSAMDCKCDMAHFEFDDAATRARRARDASDGRDFVDNINRAIRSYNAALSAVRMCASERRR